ncbi:NUDIX hydrolase [Polycladomyces abyssicola]|jgi:8-oxo-dGTP diphosphatase|uniref:NUDIX hydrolase n=1 Tax=Polycladomyces abyssicola TaxID=1125966 RepID=A0A8D5UI44_9BACL|nr:NUDIX domain-containing protein [Polycladomyces abyssicola]BCU82523.1 NUDIX hydrolase [Polycladomyces abyssicola]
MLPKHHVAAAGIVWDDAKGVLLIQRADNHHWEPPGGVVELDEALDAAVIREIREETGIEVKVIRLIGVYKTIGRNGTHVVSLVFLCTPVGGTLQLSPETVNVGFFPIEMAMNMVKRKWIRIRLEDAIREWKDVPVRSYLHPEK